MNTENLYQEGAIVSAKVNPELKLKIARYYQRIYYCAPIDAPTQKQFAYFERELIQPVV
ncbi:MAG: hypothetical protein JNM57_13110 [Cyclobacteriaceae bacterium]|nr:hypothetical protein [Cyclobacteriaceae bacterium]